MDAAQVDLKERNQSKFWYSNGKINEEIVENC